MNDESITKRLSELFELHKSGAITKEEYDKLKKQILSEDAVENAESKEKQELETAKTTDKSVKVNKSGKILKFAIVVIVLIVVSFLVFNASRRGGIKDQDGNSYKTIKIGNQIWMAENLKTTKFNDATSIPLVTDNNEWDALTAPAYCWYNNDELSYKNEHGALYNWFAVNTKKLCPTGWHVPTDVEWRKLDDYLIKNGYGYKGSETDIGKSMAATLGWISSPKAGTVGNDQMSNNRSGFTALPSGGRSSTGIFSKIGSTCYWWCSTENSSTYAYTRSMTYFYSTVDSVTYYKRDGFSVRCLRD